MNAYDPAGNAWVTDAVPPGSTAVRPPATVNGGGPDGVLDPRNAVRSVTVLPVASSSSAASCGSVPSFFKVSFAKLSTVTSAGASANSKSLVVTSIDAGAGVPLSTDGLSFLP